MLGLNVGAPVSMKVDGEGVVDPCGKKDDDEGLGGGVLSITCLISGGGGGGEVDMKSLKHAIFS